MNVFKQIGIGAGVASLVVALQALGTPAGAADLKVGVLHCDVGGGWGYVVGSSKKLQCVYSPFHGEPERYIGTISKFGLDIGYTHGGVIIWNVVAPALHPAAGALQGGYAGATASASVGIGGGAHVLVGGLDRSIALQPVSIVGESGLNIAAGIGAMTLEHTR